MDTSKLFKNKLPALENLSNKPTVFWYVSAGVDFRGPVFLTQNHIDHLVQHRNRGFIKPDLFVYNCLGEEVKDLREKLSRGKVELFNDHSTKIEGVNYQSLSIQDNLDIQIDENYIHLSPDQGSEAFYFELEITGENYSEKQRILYFEHENIDFFNKVILKNYFNVVYLCATREGCGFGNCEKSIVEYIYKDSSPLFYTNQGFKPKYTILFNDFTRDLFNKAVGGSTVVNIPAIFNNYIDETQNGGSDATIYKLEYNTI